MERTEDTAEAWDKKGRQIDTAKTGENVVLIPLPANIDTYRKNLMHELNQERAKLSAHSKMNETYIKIKGKGHYLYRAIAPKGMTLDI